MNQRLKLLNGASGSKPPDACIAVSGQCGDDRRNPASTFRTEVRRWSVNSIEVPSANFPDSACPPPQGVSAPFDGHPNASTTTGKITRYLSA